MPTVVYAAPDEMLDVLVRRATGTERLGNTEAVLDANPGLAAIGAYLPAAHPVVIPDGLPTAAAPSAAPRPKTSLW